MRDTRRTRRVLIVLLVAALALVAFGYSDGSSPVLRGIRHATGSVFGGIEHVASSVAGFFGGSSASSGQVRQLQQQVMQLRTELSQAQLSKSDYQQLHQLLELAGQGQYRVQPATVIAVGQGYQQTVTLDAGSADGVRTDETVLNGDGLVGQVTAVTATTCTVLLATDASSVVGIALAPSGDIGKVTGSGNAAGTSGLLNLEVYDSAATLTVGEAMVTAASVNDQPFVPGVPVGTIAKVINKAGSLTPLALVKPYVDFAALGVVGVVIEPPAHNPHFSVLPPIPHPLPAVTVTVTARPSPSPAATGG
ncbi:MAG TPA: rod shape-determining protein MreC [Streptosporangiaceae bacterium]|nr:rod shape-determining protein MreC [Streptosporangiaceae bacterium]